MALGALFVGTALVAGVALVAGEQASLPTPRAVLPRTASRDTPATASLPPFEPRCREPQPLRRPAPPPRPARVVAEPESEARDACLVYGRVLRGGRPVAHATVWAGENAESHAAFDCARDERPPANCAWHRHGPRDIVAGASTDPQGRFELELTGHGAPLVWASGPDGGRSQIVRLQPPLDSSIELELQLPASDVHLAGRVVGAAAGVRVHLVGGATTTTDADGGFAFRAIPPGRTALHACVPFWERRGRSSSDIPSHHDLDLLPGSSTWVELPGAVRRFGRAACYYRGPADAGSPSTVGPGGVAPPTNPAGATGAGHGAPDRR